MPCAGAAASLSDRHPHSTPHGIRGRTLRAHGGRPRISVGATSSAVQCGLPTLPVPARPATREGQQLHARPLSLLTAIWGEPMHSVGRVRPHFLTRFDADEAHSPARRLCRTIPRCCLADGEQRVYSPLSLSYTMELLLTGATTGHGTHTTTAAATGMASPARPHGHVPPCNRRHPTDFSYSSKGKRERHGPTSTGGGTRLPQQAARGRRALGCTHQFTEGGGAPGCASGSR